ncbi:competence/damage-inducible protein A [Caldisericum exile]|uniref:competence/damage-inducible protein A n=1 Tax=Caldisericum exile TaxID=693075 RepID=UPI003C792025
MRIALIIIGDEILDGLREDENFRVAKKYLKNKGSLDLLIFVRDNLNELKRVLNFVKNSFDIVLTSGGLGLTPDDITLRAFSEAFNLPLAKNEKKLEIVKKNIERVNAIQYTNFIDELSEGLSGSTPIENPKGVAAGEKIKIENTTFYILPGVPKEFEAILKIILTDFTSNKRINKVEYEVDEKEARLIKVLREVEYNFNVKTASYPPIHEKEKLKIILYGNGWLKEAKDYFETTLKNAKIPFKEISPSHTS